MRKLFKIFLGSIVILGFSQCGSCKETSYKLQKEAPFSVAKATYIDWVAGVRGGGSGTNVFLLLEHLELDNVQIDSMYFRGQKAKVEINGANFIGRFKTDRNQRQDIIIHSDPQKEYGNQAPKIDEKPPFKILDDEAVISYMEKGKLNYYKVKLEKGKERLHE